LLKNAVGAQSFSLEDSDLLSVENIEDLLKLSIEFENDTVLFYGMLQPLIEDQKTLEQLHAIIQEEKNHIARLKAFLYN